MTPVVELPPPVPAAKPSLRKAVGGVLLHDVDWKTYSKLLKAFEEHPGVKLTYDRGVLEIMSPSLRHDHRDRILFRLVIALTEELGLPIFSGGSTTMRRKRKRKGIEGDEIFWIANAPKMAGVDVLNLKVNPPPDLAIEVDESRSSLDRMGIYAALNVPEVWRLEKEKLTFYTRDAEKSEYLEVPMSLAFPFVSSTDLMPFINQSRGVGNDNATVADFRVWIRERIAAPPAQ